MSILQKRLKDFYPDNDPQVYFDREKSLIVAEIPEITATQFDSTIVTSHGVCKIYEMIDSNIIFETLSENSITFSNNDTLQDIFSDSFGSTLFINNQDTSKLNNFFASEHIKNILKDFRFEIAYGRCADDEGYSHEF